jgi:hypothetical protein
MMRQQWPSRLPGPREPNGRLSRAKAFVPITVLRQMVAAGKINGLYTSAFGLMLVNDVISQNQFDAGVRLAKARLGADRALGVRRIQAQDLMRSMGHSDGDETEESALEKRLSIKRYDAAVDAIGGEGSQEYKAVERIIFEIQHPDTYEQVIALKRALTRLTHHYSGRV